MQRDKGVKAPAQAGIEDFEEGSSESAEVVHGLLGRIADRGLVVGREEEKIAPAGSNFLPNRHRIRQLLSR